MTGSRSHRLPAAVAAALLLGAAAWPALAAEKTIEDLISPEGPGRPPRAPGNAAPSTSTPPSAPAAVDPAVIDPIGSAFDASGGIGGWGGDAAPLTLPQDAAGGSTLGGVPVPVPDVSLTAPVSPHRLPTTIDTPIGSPGSGSARLPSPIDPRTGLPGAALDSGDIDARIDKGLTDAGESSMFPPDYAFGAFQRGFFLTAFSMALDRAKSGDAKSQTLLGVLLSRGLGVREDQTAAADWFRLAGERGEPEALYALGRMYLDGTGVAQDLPKAADLFEKAAKAGQPVAARELAYMLLQGRGRPVHATLAAAYLRRAASKGDMDAQYALGGLYAEGVGLDASEEQAVRWYGAAARNGSVPAEVEYGVRLFNGVGVAKNEAQAARWFAEAARSGNPAAQIRLARLFAEGRGVDKNAAEAARWFQIAKAQDEDDSFMEEWFGRLDEASRKAAFAAADAWLGRPAAGAVLGDGQSPPRPAEDPQAAGAPASAVPGTPSPATAKAVEPRVDKQVQ